MLAAEALCYNFEIEAKPREMGRPCSSKPGSTSWSLVNEPMYKPGSADNVRSYAREYNVTDAEYQPCSRHGLVLGECGFVRQSCILLAARGATSVHEHSIAIVDNTCFVAVGDTLCSLSLPLLDLLWHRQVDWATCFGVYFSANHYRRGNRPLTQTWSVEE